MLLSDTFYGNKSQKVYFYLLLYNGFDYIIISYRCQPHQIVILFLKSEKNLNIIRIFIPLLKFISLTDVKRIRLTTC